MLWDSDNQLEFDHAIYFRTLPSFLEISYNCYKNQTLHQQTRQYFILTKGVLIIWVLNTSKECEILSKFGLNFAYINFGFSSSWVQGR
jgi:hypothetical protein